MNQKTNNTRSGSGLIFAVVLLFVILGMVVTLSSVTVLETKMNQKTKSSVGAFYNADSGVEWALNQIATKNGSDRISTIPSCPFTGCSVLFLGADGKVLNPAIATNTIDKVKAVRSVGTQGGETQRAIEAAVAVGGVTYDSGAFNVASNQCYQFTHGLGDIPQLITVYYRDSASYAWGLMNYDMNDPDEWGTAVKVNLTTIEVCFRDYTTLYGFTTGTMPASAGPRSVTGQIRIIAKRF